jgi:CheY-like chemotaxis protein
MGNLLKALEFLVAQPRLNLKGVTALVVDSDHFTRGLVTQMLRGFGIDTPGLCETGAAAKAFLQHNYVDLCLIEAVLPDMESPELIGWIRSQEKAMRFIPVIVLTGYTQLRMVAAARDGGANNVVKKPVSPQGLFDRITWVARVSRPFIETTNYMGPDRRFRTLDPPDGEYKRENDTQHNEEGTRPVTPESVNRLAQAMTKGLSK